MEGKERCKVRSLECTWKDITERRRLEVRVEIYDGGKDRRFVREHDVIYNSLLLTLESMLCYGAQRESHLRDSP